MDRCHGDRAVEDVGPLVEPRGHGTEVLQRIDGPLNFVPPLVVRLVETCRPPAPAATAFPVGSLVLRFGDGVLDLAPTQVAAVSPGGVRLVTAEMFRPCARAASAEPADTDAFHDGDELGGVAPLARSDQRDGSCRSVRPGSVRGPRRGGAAVACVFSPALAEVFFALRQRAGEPGK